MCNNRFRTNDHIAITSENVAKKVIGRDEKLDFEQIKRNASKG
jgi:hypothetical protein